MRVVLYIFEVIWEYLIANEEKKLISITLELNKVK